MHITLLPVLPSMLDLTLFISFTSDQTHEMPNAKSAPPTTATLTDQTVGQRIALSPGDVADDDGEDTKPMIGIHLSSSSFLFLLWTTAAAFAQNTFSGKKKNILGCVNFLVII